MESVLLIATASLVTQIIVLVLLVLGYSFKRNLQYRKHGAAMASAVIVHAVTIFLVMVPSFSAIVSPNVILPEPHQLVYAAGIVHALTGTLAFLLGVWLVVAWRFGKNVQGCIRRKKFMLGTMSLWVVAIVLGLVLYGVFYTPLIFG